MTMSTRAKEFLKRYQLALIKIGKLTMEIERLQLDREGISKGGSAGRSGALSDITGQLAARIVDAQREVEALRLDAIADRGAVVRVLNQVDDPRYLELLTMRYIELTDWVTIADHLGYSLRYAFKLHEEALAEVEEILAGSKEDI